VMCVYVLMMLMMLMMKWELVWLNLHCEILYPLLWGRNIWHWLSRVDKWRVFINGWWCCTVVKWELFWVEIF
jgi:hypothetical protein